MDTIKNTVDATTNAVAHTTQTAGNIVDSATNITSNGLSSTYNSVKESVSPLLDAFSSAAPKVLMGILLLIGGLILASILESATKKLLNMIKLDETSEKIGLKDSLEKIGLNFSFSNLVAKFVKYAIVIITLMAASNIAGLDGVSKILEDLMNFLPQLFTALIILAIGFVGGNFIKKLAVNATSATSLSDKEGYLMGSIAKGVTITITSFMALSQLGIANDILVTLMSGLMLAFALAVGLGSKKAVERFWEKFQNKSDD